MTSSLDEIERHHILQVIKEVDAVSIERFPIEEEPGKSRCVDVQHVCTRYSHLPLRAVIRRAYMIATGRELDKDTYGSEAIFARCGFVTLKVID